MLWSLQPFFSLWIIKSAGQQGAESATSPKGDKGTTCLFQEKLSRLKPADTYLELYSTTLVLFLYFLRKNTKTKHMQSYAHWGQSPKPTCIFTHTQHQGLGYNLFRAIYFPLQVSREEVPGQKCWLQPWLQNKLHQFVTDYFKPWPAFQQRLFHFASWVWVFRLTVLSH